VPPKRPGRGTDHLPQPSTEVKNAWSYTSALPYMLISCSIFWYNSFSPFSVVGLTKEEASVLRIITRLKKVMLEMELLAVSVCTSATSSLLL
jgi:hypothetical protein